MALSLLGYDPVTKRSLFSLFLRSAAELPVTINLHSDNFACFIAWDASGAPADQVASLVESLLRWGASYFVCWGPDCERVHDIIDEIASYPFNDLNIPEESCIMTTWHDSESLADALQFFMVHSEPDEHYKKTTRAALAICIGSEPWSRAITAAIGECAQSRE